MPILERDQINPSPLFGSFHSEMYFEKGSNSKLEEHDFVYPLDRDEEVPSLMLKDSNDTFYELSVDPNQKKQEDSDTFDHGFRLPPILEAIPSLKIPVNQPSSDSNELDKSFTETGAR
jgi:hypothetical protein